MTRSHHIARDLAIAALGYAALGTWSGVLVPWSRRCAADKPYAG